MKAVMLAAGRGTRLSGFDDSHPPKSLLRFGGRSLLDRHIATLKALGIEELALVVGYRAEALRAEAAALGAGGFVRFLDNPHYTRGSVVSLWTAREVLREGETLYMDADVLYDPVLLRRLMASPAPTCFPIDRAFEEGDEPVKLCLRAGRPVEFRKVIGDVAFDTVGEWVGFIRMAADFAAALAAETERFVTEGRLDEPCEEAMRAVLLSGTAPAGIEDITGLPWIEIDFPEDVIRAEREILPRIGG